MGRIPDARIRRGGGGLSVVGDRSLYGKVILNGSILHGSVRWVYRVRDVTKRRPRPAAPLVASVLVHAAAVVALLTLSFPTQEIPAPPLQRARRHAAGAGAYAGSRIATAGSKDCRDSARTRALQARHFYAPAVLAAPIPPSRVGVGSRDRYPAPFAPFTRTADRRVACAASQNRQSHVAGCRALKLRRLRQWSVRRDFRAPFLGRSVPLEP